MALWRGQRIVFIPVSISRVVGSKKNNKQQQLFNIRDISIQFYCSIVCLLKKTNELSKFTFTNETKYFARHGFIVAVWFTLAKDVQDNTSFCGHDTWQLLTNQMREFIKYCTVFLLNGIIHNVGGYRHVQYKNVWRKNIYIRGKPPAFKLKLSQTTFLTDVMYFTNFL